MNEQMKLLVNMLKDRVNTNLQVIKKNEEKIRLILSQPVSIERSNLLAENFNINKKLLEENHDSLNLELQMINYLNKFKELMKHQSNFNQSLGMDNNQEKDNFSNELFIKSGDEEEKENSSDADLLNMTIRGELTFDSNHPMYNNIDFLEDLIDGFSKIENYEMCSQLINLKRHK